VIKFFFIKAVRGNSDKYVRNASVYPGIDRLQYVNDSKCMDFYYYIETEAVMHRARV
jgi:hypothetical protein